MDFSLTIGIILIIILGVIMFFLHKVEVREDREIRNHEYSMRSMDLDEGDQRIMMKKLDLLRLGTRAKRGDRRIRSTNIYDVQAALEENNEY